MRRDKYANLLAPIAPAWLFDHSFTLRMALNQALRFNLRFDTGYTAMETVGRYMLC